MLVLGFAELLPPIGGCGRTTSWLPGTLVLALGTLSYQWLRIRRARALRLRSPAPGV
jgi:hypothetical protein